MRIAYFDCASGISGDMFLGALVDAGLPVERLSAEIEALGIAGLALTAKKVTRLGISATKVEVLMPHEHAHRNLADIERIIDASRLSSGAKEMSKKIFARLAAAEAKVHNKPVSEVHFHEVGALDSIADIVGAAAGLELLGIDKCVFSAIPVGSGYVKMAHGTLPVPAPATAELLVGVPIRETAETGELATPTGAAIAVTAGAAFGAFPAMTVSAVGGGAGSREGKTVPNVLRVFIGEAAGEQTPRQVTVIEASIDDMTGEMLAYATERLFAAGALDVYLTPILMKKGRPAQLVTILVDDARKPAVLETLFAETTTFGARSAAWDREILDRAFVEVETELGAARIKVGRRAGRTVSASPEYEDVKRIAIERGIPARHVYARLSAEAGKILDTGHSDPGRSDPGHPDARG